MSEHKHKWHLDPTAHKVWCECGADMGLADAVREISILEAENARLQRELSEAIGIIEIDKIKRGKCKAEVAELHECNRKLVEALRKHREASYICCDETCFCWDAEAILEAQDE